MRRIHPVPSVETTVEEAYSSPLGSGTTDRPWVQLCMVSSLDGSTAIDGTSGALSSPNDTAILLQLRSLADVILVGAQTAVDEGYGQPNKPGQRIGVVTRTGRLDTTIEPFRSGAGFVVTTETADIATDGIDGVDGIDVLRAGRDKVNLAAIIAEIGRRYGATTIQAEGGSMLNGALFDADVVDELDLSTSPGVVGGDGPRLTRSSGRFVRKFSLQYAAFDDDQFLFQRWRRRR